MRSRRRRNCDARRRCRLGNGVGRVWDERNVRRCRRSGRQASLGSSRLQYSSKHLYRDVILIVRAVAALDDSSENDTQSMAQLAFPIPVSGKDTSLNRLGGHPIFPPTGPSPPSTFAKCPSCNSSDAWFLLGQFEAPVDDRERLMYVFGCNKSVCSKKGALRAFRCIKAADKSVEETKGKALEAKVSQKPSKHSATQPASTNGFKLPAFEGSTSFSEDEEENPASKRTSATDFPALSTPASSTRTSSAILASFKLPTFGGSTSFSDDEEEGDSKVDATSKLANDLDTLLKIREQPHRKQQQNPNEDSGKKTAKQADKKPPSYASAAKPPSQPAPSPISSVDNFTNEASFDWSTLPSLPEHGVEWDYEYLYTSDSDPSDNESESAPSSSNANDVPSDLDSEAYLPEAYEKPSYPKGVTDCFRRFQKAVAENPEAVVRYGGSPIFYSKPVAKVEIGLCKCGSERTFELQILPGLLSTLKTMDKALAKKSGDPRTWETGMEFGTVLVYCCVKSCSGKQANGWEWSWVEEGVVVQTEE